MKINKILFSCSDGTEYSPFWNVQAKLWSHMGIEPVCLLFGKKANTEMTEEFGKIIEMPIIPGLPWSVQMVWSKFDFPRSEPETTWLMGDIDLVPLQKAHFTSRIAEIPDDAYANLNAGGISQPRLGSLDGFITQGPQRLWKDKGLNGGTDIPGHYHVAKGKLFEIYAQGRSFEEQVRHIVDSHRYGMGVMDNLPQSNALENPYWYYWCGEENYSSERLYQEASAGRVQFYPVYYNNNNNEQRVNRDVWNNETMRYSFTPDKVASGQMVDVHCARPFAKQADALNELIDLSGILK